MKQVPVGTPMRPGSGGVGGGGGHGGVVGSIYGPHEAWGCVIF